MPPVNSDSTLPILSFAAGNFLRSDCGALAKLKFEASFRTCSVCRDGWAFLRTVPSTSKITGHVGVIVGWPTEIPDWAGAWAVRIADSTRGGHGDDPRAADLDGGFGVGTMLFVTDAAGVVTHYGWIGLASPWLMPTTVLFGRVAG